MSCPGVPRPGGPAHCLGPARQQAAADTCRAHLNASRSVSR